MDIPVELIQAFRGKKQIVALTGAGISKESDPNDKKEFHSIRRQVTRIKSQPESIREELIALFRGTTLP